MIDHDAAEKLRSMLSDIQQKAMSHPDVKPSHSMELVAYIRRWVSGSSMKWKACGASPGAIAAALHT
jgi:hypothetical protein